MRPRGILAACAALLAVALPAHAEDTVSWTPPQVAGWNIAVDRTLGNGCFIFTEYEGGTFLRIGFNRLRSNAYLMLGNEKWRSVEPGKDYVLTLKFDNEQPWEAKARGILIGQYSYLWMETGKTDFVIEFMRTNGMSISYRGGQVTSLSLRGSAAAVSEMLRCQNAMESNKSGSDPFAGGQSSNSGDPFAN